MAKGLDGAYAYFCDDNNLRRGNDATFRDEMNNLELMSAFISERRAAIVKRHADWCEKNASR